MPQLIRDRYFPIDQRYAWDLATGDTVNMEHVVVEHAAARGAALPAALLELLDEGREGRPRWMGASLAAAMRSLTCCRQLAAEATARGYVPIDVEVYTRLRPVLDDVLRDRTLALIARGGRSRPAARALVDASAASPRPHLLLTMESPSIRRITAVREARAVYGAGLPRPSRPVAADVAAHLARAARAAVFVREGRHAAAERLLRDTIGAVARRGAGSEAARLGIQLGQLLLERGRFAGAIDAFDMAARHAGADDEVMTVARVWQATASVDAGRLTAAEALCRAVLVTDLASTSTLLWARAVLRRVLLRQGQHEEIGVLVPVGETAWEDPACAAFCEGVTVSALLALGRSFDAGVAVGRLKARVARCAELPRLLALTAEMRWLAAMGAVEGVEAAYREIVQLARAARCPMRAVRARAILAGVLAAVGRAREAERHRRMLRRVGRVVPAFRGGDAGSTRLEPQPPRIETPAFRMLPSLIDRVQREDDDRAAVEGMLRELAGRLDASRIDAWSAGDPVSIVLTTGGRYPSTCGRRIVELGLALEPEAGDDGRQAGVPMRVGSRIVGALVGRWPMDRAVPSHAVDLFAAAAALVAPRFETWQAARRDRAAAASAIPELVGMSRAIADVRQSVIRAAAAPFAVLIEGESGAGKELIARALHQLGPRRERRFCDVNCAALPDDLLEAELFGHARGAFTGAVTERAGLFEQADGGTLFLDEIADLSLRAQAKLLRAVQEQETRRVGETFARRVDVRIVAAANRDMRAEVQQGRFRQDLLYRLDVIRIRVPPLRERRDDIPLLAHHFWRLAAAKVGSAATLTPAVVAALCAHDWPGNVRELQNVMATLAVSAPARGRIGRSSLPPLLHAADDGQTTLAEARAAFERRFVEDALARAAGNRARAARALGLTRQGLLKLIDRVAER